MELDSTQLDGEIIIDINVIQDAQFSAFTPTFRDLRGNTFYVPDPYRAEIRLSDAILPDTEIQHDPANQTGKPSIGIKWFQADLNDYKAWSPEDVERSCSR